MSSINMTKCRCGHYPDKHVKLKENCHAFLKAGGRCNCHKFAAPEPTPAVFLKKPEPILVPVSYDVPRCEQYHEAVRNVDGRSIESQLNCVACSKVKFEHRCSCKAHCRICGRCDMDCVGHLGNDAIVMKSQVY